jgi:hypothetical protein
MTNICRVEITCRDGITRRAEVVLLVLRRPRERIIVGGVGLL